MDLKKHEQLWRKERGQPTVQTLPLKKKKKKNEKFLPRSKTKPGGGDRTSGGGLFCHLTLHAAEESTEPREESKEERFEREEKGGDILLALPPSRAAAPTA